MQKTSVDFSNHVLTIHNPPVPDAPYAVRVFKFAKPNTVIQSVVFIVLDDSTYVKGDFGRWSFCRPFVPAAGEFISRNYADEKATIGSAQKTHVFGGEKAIPMIERFKREILDLEGELNEETVRWFDELCAHARRHDESEYKSTAYRKTPTDIPLGSVPDGMVRHPHLEMVYDAFDVICERLKHQQDEK